MRCAVLLNKRIQTPAFCFCMSASIHLAIFRVAFDESIKCFITLDDKSWVSSLEKTHCWSQLLCKPHQAQAHCQTVPYKFVPRCTRYKFLCILFASLGVFSYLLKGAVPRRTEAFVYIKQHFSNSYAALNFIPIDKPVLEVWRRFMPICKTTVFSLHFGIKDRTSS